jgi:hypothetical protein
MLRPVCRHLVLDAPGRLLLLHRMGRRQKEEGIQAPNWYVNMAALTVLPQGRLPITSGVTAG